MRRLFPILAVLLIAGCGSSGSNQDVVSDVVQDVAGDDGQTADVGSDQGHDTALQDVIADTEPGDTAIEDGQDDSAQDTGADTTEDATPDFDSIEQPYPPRALPFEFTRPAEGEPIPAADVTAFTQDMADAYKTTGFFRWLLRTSTGVDHSIDSDDYLAWHNDIQAVKDGETVTFKHQGGEHNMWIAGSMVLTSVANGYLLTGDWEMARLTEQYCKGLTAVVKGFIYDENDPAPWLMARAIFPMDQDFTLDTEFWKDDGRRKVVEFHEMYHNEDGWNAHTFAWPTNPAWGSIYITNMRSKDDVRAISRTSTWLPYVVSDAQDEWVRTACQETLDTMKAFHKDIVDNEYFIRTKGTDGVAYRIPCDDQDLGSYACYMTFDPRSECCARMSADMIAYGERKTNDCGTCTGSVYDGFASAAHYYNIPIIWDYHMAGVGTSLVNRQYRDAWYALVGLAERIDSYMHPKADEPGTDDPRWGSDMAVLLVQAASMGLPLTAAEARHVQSYFSTAADEYRAWPNWDPWAETVPDGVFALRPSRTYQGIEVEAFAILMEYCNSPFKNPAGAAFVDCEVLASPENW